MNSFREAYGVLSRHALTLRNQQEPNIDDLLSIVTESVDAYKVCKQRIDAVEAALEKALADPDVAASVQPEPKAGARRSAPVVRPAPQPSASAPTTGFEDMDDDIPF